MGKVKPPDLNSNEMSLCHLTNLGLFVLFAIAIPFSMYQATFFFSKSMEILLSRNSAVFLQNLGLSKVPIVTSNKELPSFLS